MMNKAPFTIEVQEDRRPGDPWIEVQQDQCVPLWPRTDSSKLLRVKSKDDMNLSSPFKMNEVQCSLLRFNNKVILCVVELGWLNSKNFKKIILCSTVESMSMSR